MHRRNFLASLGIAATASQIGCAGRAVPDVAGARRLKRVGIQLYTLRDDAKADLEGTLANIANAGYKDVELLSSMENFGYAPSRLRTVLDRLGLAAPSTHVGGAAFDNLDREIDDAKILGHRYIVLASLPITGQPTLDDYRRWADRLNEAGRRARERRVWIAFHDEAWDFRPIGGVVPYDVLAERTDPAMVRLQLDTGNLAMGGRDPLEYLQKYGSRYYLFHIKDVPQLGAEHDTELGKGMIDFRRLLAGISDIDEKFLFVEQESYPGAPIESVRRDYDYISKLEF